MSKKAESLEELLKSAEAAIRSGQSRAVAAQLSRVQPSRVPRSLRLPAANLCRRVQLVGLGMKFLAPVVRAEGKKLAHGASDAELAEYAALLERAGAVKESLRLLSRIDKTSVPNALLFEAFCYFSSWDYDLSIPVLRQFLKSDLAPYSKLVGQVNLASALIATEQFEEARDILDRLIAETQGQSYARLMANSLELRAQTHLFRGSFDLAERDLENAETMVQSERTHDLHFVRKWRAISGALRQGDVNALLEFRDGAQERGDWESVREADRFLVSVSFEHERFSHLLFGTPFSKYRERIMKAAPPGVKPDFYRYGSGRGPCIDLSSGAVEGAIGLRAGFKNHQVLAALLKDFYRPLSLGALFAELFPGEHFDVYSSANRVHQCLFRVREWMRESALPIAIREEDGAYRLAMTGDVSFRILLEHAPVDLSFVQLRALRSRFGTEPFGSREGQAALSVSPATWRRLMAWAIEAGQVERFGATTSTRYALLPELKKKAG